MNWKQRKNAEELLASVEILLLSLFHKDTQERKRKNN